LLRGVDSRVGTAGDGDADRRICDPGKCILQRLLDRDESGLPLPAAKAAAVILDAERELTIDGVPLR